MHFFIYFLSMDWLVNTISSSPIIKNNHHWIISSGHLYLKESFGLTEWLRRLCSLAFFCKLSAYNFFKHSLILFRLFAVVLSATKTTPYPLKNCLLTQKTWSDTLLRNRVIIILVKIWRLYLSWESFSLCLYLEHSARHMLVLFAQSSGQAPKELFLLCHIVFQLCLTSFERLF